MAADIGEEIELEIGHVLFADIVGYSKLSLNEQHAVIDELNEVVRGSQQYRRAEASGRLLKLVTGDGMALVFYTSPEAPAQCAVEISRALKQHPRLQVRIGIHSGPVSGVIDVNNRPNLAGAGINIAQRVMACGDAGHILVSKHVSEDLEEHDKWRPRLHDLGTCEVKHGMRIGLANLYDTEIGNPQLPTKLQAVRKHHRKVRWTEVAVTLLVISAITFGFWWRSNGPISAITEKSIAVLPFANLSRDPDNAYFADGIQDEILTRLSKIADLKVISRTSTQRYKSAPENLPQIGKQLRVAHIVEGSVQKSGDAVRVSVQLIRANDDSHVWAESFDRKLTDILSVESEVAKMIAEQLRAHLTGPEEQLIAAKPTDNVEAYDAYLRGLAYTVKTATTSTNTLAAQKYLREAVRLEPRFALAWALLSYIDSTGYLTTGLQPTLALREEARQAAETALTLQPDLGEAILAKGYYYYGCLRDYDTAVRYFERARQSLPNNSRIPASLAYVARRRGEWGQSEAYFNEAERLDPRNVSLLTQHALSHIYLRRFVKALRKLNEVLDITPDDVDTLLLKVAIAQGEGDLSRASALLDSLQPTNDPGLLERQAYQVILERRPAEIIPRLRGILAKPDSGLGANTGDVWFWLGWAEKVAGDYAAAQKSWQQARSELEPFLAEQPENFFLIGELALINAGLADKPAALALAERAMTVLSPEKDAADGLMPIEFLARVAALVGEPDRAIAALQKLLSRPYDGALSSPMPLTPALLRLDPMFDPLRNDPRFQSLCEDKQK
jgi:TolB-like protein/tetratricopeptide (TPR) repeat protein